jgi:Flp pilus assembly protein TadB
MAELEKWLIDLLNNPDRLVAFLLGAGILMFLIGPLWWRSSQRRRDELDKVERDLQRTKERVEELERKRNEAAPLLTRLAQESLLRRLRPGHSRCRGSVIR